MELHPGEQELFRGRPSWRSLLGFHTGTLVLAIAMGVIGKLASSTGTGFAIGIGVLAGGIFVGFLRRVGTSYVITNERLHIRRGLFSKTVQETRIARVQNVSTRQSVTERVLQVGTVDFDTAGTEGSDFQFTGVANPEKTVRAVDVAQRSGDMLTTGGPADEPAGAEHPAPAPPAAETTSPLPAEPPSGDPPTAG